MHKTKHTITLTKRQVLRAVLVLYCYHYLYKLLQAIYPSVDFVPFVAVSQGIFLVKTGQGFLPRHWKKQ